MMKNKINILFLALFAMLATACEEDEGPFTGPYRIVIAGPHSAVPGDVEEFTIGDINNPGSYTWAVDGPANIVGDNTGNTVQVEFTGVTGEEEEFEFVTLTVTNGPDNGLLEIEVDQVEPNFSVSLNEFGALRSGATDTVFFTFDAPLAATPSIAIHTGETDFNQGDPFISGSIGDLVQMDDNTFFALFTAGEGNGTPEAVLRNIRGTEMFGGVEIDSAFAQLYRVDNIAPVASLSYSETIVNNNTEVTVTATFSEEVRPEQGSDMFITFSGAGVDAETGTLKVTNNPLVYTYQFTTNGGGNGTVNVDLENVADFAGNELAAVDNRSELRVDNTSPTIVSSTASDEGNSVRISLLSSETGTGWYTVLQNNADAPESVGDFSGGVRNGTFDLEGGSVRSASIALAPGQYDVYFIVSDRAGNFSTIRKVDLTVD